MHTYRDAFSSHCLNSSPDNNELPARAFERLLVLGIWCWCCELAVRVVETGCRCWCWVPGAAAGGVGGGASWVWTRWRGCWCWCWCWCWVPAGAGCRVPVLVLVLAKRTGAGVSWSCALWRCRKLAVQAACILVPASRTSTGCGILPSYLGQCWCNFLMYVTCDRRPDRRGL